VFTFFALLLVYRVIFFLGHLLPCIHLIAVSPGYVAFLSFVEAADRPQTHQCTQFAQVLLGFLYQWNQSKRRGFHDGAAVIHRKGCCAVTAIDDSGADNTHD
jgi:hypothetical protein